MINNNLMPYLKPSGLNELFYGADLRFNDYITLMQKIITAARVDITNDNINNILFANSPFSLNPCNNSPPPKKGILLIHGLFDSPFYVRDLGNYFSSQGFLVKAVLLPGHGTVPGDLLNIDYIEWIKAVNYGFESLCCEVEQIYLAGYSLGGILTLYHYLKDPMNELIKGLILFAPALKPKSLFKNLMARYHRLFSWISPNAKWFEIRDANNYAKYSCYALNAGRQACRIIDDLKLFLKTRLVEIPLFIALSSDDETISEQAILAFFLQQPNPKNKLLIYTKSGLENGDPRIVQRTSAYPHLNIIDFSHSCLTISPRNTYLGEKSQFLDFHHYPHNHTLQKKEIYLGAASKLNKKNYYLSRLSYNPDFEYLTQEISHFLAAID